MGYRLFLTVDAIAGGCYPSAAASTAPLWRYDACRFANASGSRLGHLFAGTTENTGLWIEGRRCQQWENLRGGWILSEKLIHDGVLITPSVFRVRNGTKFSRY